MTDGHLSAAIYRDTRDLTPFRSGQVRTPAREIAESVSGLIHGALGGRDAGLISVDGEVPRLKRLPGKVAKAVYEAVFTSSQADRLITLARAHPGWAGLCYVMAGLLSYKQGGYLHAVELLQRGLSMKNDDDANQFAYSYLSRVVTRVELAERIHVPVLFSEESVFLALSHSLRETGQTAAAFEALAALPPSLPTALARCGVASTLGWDEEVVAWTDGLLNADDLAAALLLVRARSLRRLGRREAALVAIKEVLRRQKTSMALRNDALTDQALLLLDNGRSLLNPRERRRRRRAELDSPKDRRKDAEMHELWDREYSGPSGR